MNEGATSVGRLGMIIGAIAAPTSLITALLYYFGYYHAYWFFAYFGVNSSVLGFGTTDYLMRSLDALWVPMTVTAAAGLLAFWAHDMLRGRLGAEAWIRAMRYVVPATLSLGLLLALGGLWSTFTQTFLNRVLVLAPLSLSIGVTLLAYALHLKRTVLPTALSPSPADPDDAPPAGTSGPPDNDHQDTDQTDPPDDTHGTVTPHPRPEWAALAEWAVILVLVGLGLVWAANDYAASVGETRARRYAAELENYPSAVLYGERSLSISAPGVRETRCHDDKAAYAYRYDGLTLVMESGRQYVLLPYRWTPADGVALVIPRSNSVRLEFGPPPHARTTAAPTTAC
ncbi:MULTISPECIES: hypothetical protein [unclassified Streptomyces]|uniref:hypothetical protein n=1 Tax=unclassified Streptomyces TaxID=2593676 RepID=UPI000ACDF677|nr:MULTISPECIES: hypothetical protein [unclassified Streptomyces]